MTCVVLNADYSFLNVISTKKALCLLSKGKTEVLKYGNTELFEKILKHCCSPVFYFMAVFGPAVVRRQIAGSVIQFAFISM